MYAFFISGFIISLFSFGSYWYQTTAYICPTPIHYRLGEIDKRFDLSQETAKSVALRAEQLWEGAIGKDLFDYDQSAPFAINFIYDERQQRSDTEEGWHISLDKEQAENELLIAKIKQLGKEYEVVQADYNKQRSDYENRLNSYNTKVEEYNVKGGAPKDVYLELQNEAKALNALLGELSAEEKNLNQKAEEINRLGEEGNAKIASYNAEVQEYNTLFGELETFTQGDFKRERINVYKFSTEDELTAVLAHEFGHALGIGHVDSEGAIMYYLMTKRDTSTLSSADKNAYFAVCGEETTIAQKTRRLIRSILAKV